MLRSLLIFLAASIIMLAPMSASAAETNFFGPIVPAACNCPPGPNGVPSAPDFGCVLQVVKNLINFAVSIGSIIVTLVAGYAGILLITSPFNAENRGVAKKMLMNAIIGLVITISAWLLINFLMGALYNGSAAAEAYGKAGVLPWNEIIGTGGAKECFDVKDDPAYVGTGPGLTVGGGNGGGSGINCPAADPSKVVAFSSSVTKGTSEKALPKTVENFLAMREVALKAGIDLKVTDGYRSDAEQVALWNQYCSSGTCGAKKVAKPCSLGGPGSNHNSGEAIDIEVDCDNGQSGCNTAAYKWLKNNGATWGFRNDLSTDPLHWSPSGK